MGWFTLDSWLRKRWQILLSVRSLQTWWGIREPGTVVHVGAHEAEELESYEQNSWGSQATFWVEAIPEKFEKLQKQLAGQANHEVLQAVAWDSSGDYVDFRITNNFQSSSVFDLKEHHVVHPDIHVTQTLRLETSTLEDLLRPFQLDQIDILVLDIQGSELRALQGLGVLLGTTRAIYCEFSTRELYENGPLVNDLDSFLHSQGFRRVDWVLFRKSGWGDALYLPQCQFRYTHGIRRALRRFFRIRGINHLVRAARKRQTCSFRR